MSADGNEVPAVRTGQGSTKLSREEFERGYRAQFYHPAFDAVNKEIDRLTDIAWRNYEEGDKAPRTREAGTDEGGCALTSVTAHTKDMANKSDFMAATR